MFEVYCILHSHSEGKCQENDKHRCHKQETVESVQIVFSNAFRCPWAVMIVTHYADIAVGAVIGFRRNVESTFAAEAISVVVLHCFSEEGSF